MGTRVPTIYVLSKNKKKYQKLSDEIFNFLSIQKSLYIAWACFHNDQIDHIVRQIEEMSIGRGAL